MPEPHKLGVVGFVFDGAEEHKRDSDFCGIDLVEYFEVIFGGEFLEIRDEFVSFENDAFRVEL